MITLGIDARSYDSPGRLGRYCRNVLAGMLEHGDGFRYVVWLPDHLRPELLPNLPEEARLELRACAVATGDAAGERGAFLAEINGAPLDVFCSLHSPVPAGVAAPSLLVIHDLCALKFPELHRGEAGEYWQSTLPGSLERVTAIIADSSQTAADVELYFPRHAHRTWVIPPGVESRFFDAPDPGALTATLAALGLKEREYVTAANGGEVVAGGEELDARHARAERVLLGLRTVGGLRPPAGFEEELEGLRLAGLVERRGEWVAPTRRGLDLHNQIALAVL